MSVNLLSYSKAGYIGALSAQAVQVSHGVGHSIPLAFDWLSYGASNTNQNIYVPINLAGPQNRQLLQNIRSVYIDNLGNAATIYVQFADTLQTISAQPYSSGWYPAFTNAWDVTIAAAGLSGSPASTRVFVTDIVVPPYTDIGNQQVTSLELASPSIGGGSSVSAILLLNPGSSYAGAGITISGGGGANATATAAIDAYGRFTGTNLTNGGNGYLGLPIVSPNSPNPAPANFVPTGVYNPNVLFTYLGTVWFYVANSRGVAINLNAPAWISSAGYHLNDEVNYSSSIYACTSPVVSTLPPPSDPAHWQRIGPITPVNGDQWTNTGIIPNQTAQFMAVLSPGAAVITTPGFGPRALGDQSVFYEMSPGGAGVMQDNVFGSPYGSGFIYLTSVDIKRLDNAATSITFKFSNTAGFTQWTFAYGALTPYWPILQLGNCNIRLDATKQWQFVCVAGSATIGAGFAWTYNNN